VVGCLTLVCFFMYDKAYRSYTTTLKQVIETQNITLKDQQQIINALHERNRK
jgi:hypothetical protein